MKEKNYRKFYDLPVWKNALKVSKKIYKMTSKLPKKEDYGLTSQLRRAANSIGANIAEGFGRKKKLEKVQFYSYSIGSSHETIHHLLYGQEIGYFEKEKVKKLVEKIDKIIFNLNKIIKTIKDWN